MTMQSLQDIIRLEEALYAAEQAETKKADEWLKQEEIAVNRHYDEELAAIGDELEKRKKETMHRAGEEAKSRIREAEARIGKIQGLDDAALEKFLPRIFRMVVGEKA